MSKKIRSLLVTGGSGFIGSNFIEMILTKNKSIKIINLDALTYAGNINNLNAINSNKNYLFVHGRIEDTDLVKKICIDNNVEGIINFAAESHVDNSIQNEKPFIDTNIIGTVSLLNVARELKLKKFLQVSTDEVYGSLPFDSTNKFTESSQIQPNSPYSAAKAAADGFVRAYHHTYGVPAVITRCSNNYGPKQHEEKLIPLIITNILKNKELPVYGDGMNVRDWIHVDDHCEAVWLVYEKGIPGEVYNIGSDNEWHNIDIVKFILSILERSFDLIRFVKDRPGHDKRYAIDYSKIKKELGWSPKINFKVGLLNTVSWYLLKNKDKLIK